MIATRTADYQNDEMGRKQPYTKSLRDAGVLSELRSVETCADWKIVWPDVHLGELFQGDSNLAEELLDKHSINSSRDVFRALTAHGGHASKGDIDQYLITQYPSRADQKTAKVTTYLEKLKRRARTQGYDLFVYTSDTGLWHLAAQWELISKATQQCSLQEAAVSASLGPSLPSRGIYPREGGCPARLEFLDSMHVI